MNPPAGNAGLLARIRAMPKAELHLHLEGSLSARTVLVLAGRNRLRLPWKTPQEMAGLYRYRGFQDFTKAFLLGVRCLRRAEDFAYAVEQLGDSLAAQQVRYAEVTVTPQFYVQRFPSFDEWLEALNEGRRRVKSAWGIELRWIPDIVRSVPRYAEAVAAWACSDRARSGGVVALGLGGPESAHPARDFAPVFRMARERGLPSNPHAGEGTGPQGVRDALAHLRPSRIGHGVGAASDPVLLAELAKAGLPLEVCVTSNLQLGLYPDAATHPLRALVEAGCMVTLNTDDPALFGTTLGREYARAVLECGLTEAQLSECILNAARASYLPASEKANLLHQLSHTAHAGDISPASVVEPELPFVLKQCFGGPNRYSRRPVILAAVSIPDRDQESGAVPTNRVEQLSHLLQKLQPACAEERLQSLPPAEAPAANASPGALAAHAAVMLQRWAGYPVRFSASVGFDSSRKVESIVYEFSLQKIAGAAGRLAVRLVLDSAGATGEPTPASIGLLRRFVAEHVEKPSFAVEFIKAAEARDVPWRSALQSEMLLEFGQGCHQRRLWRHFTGATSHVATILSTRKDMANALFRFHGLPVPRQQVVVDDAAALRAARSIGLPVVVKPVSMDYGTAVHVGLTSDADIRAAFAIARRHGPVLIEEQIPGDHHRLMVINGRFTSGRRQRPAHVMGDGVRAILDLVEAANRIRNANGWKPIPLDAETGLVLANQGLAIDTIPSAGEEVRLRTQGNLSTGGTMELVTDAVHPDNVRLALRAAAIAEIDVAGIDFISPDITRSHMEVGGMICEINVTPGFILGEQELILQEWFGKDMDGRIPVVAVLDPALDGHLGRCASLLLSRRGTPVCLAASGGIWLGDSRIVPGDMANARGAQIALSEPSAGAAVIELHSTGVLQDGLPFDRCAALIAPALQSNGKPGLHGERQAAIALVADMAQVSIVDADDPAVVSAGPSARGLRSIRARQAAADVCPVCGAAIDGWDAEALRTLAAELMSP